MVTFEQGRKMIDLTREEFCRVEREHFLIGHLQDRVGIQLATKRVGDQAQGHLLARSFLRNFDQRHGPEAARELGRE